jgi:serine/threonine-protein kinase
VPSFLPTNDDSKKLRTGGIVAHVKQYQVIDCVGEGGMGWIYRAWDSVLERDIALKVMKPDVPERERRRFRQEALYGARFHHPSIVRVYDLVGVPGQGISWFAMEYLPGKDMRGVLDRAQERDKLIPFRLIADTFRQTLAALQYAHDCGVIHRDVKPANMYVTRDPNTRFVTCKLLDFGVALDLRAELKQETQLCGDPRYMAPEQSRLDSELDGRADIYAAGMALYEIVTGRHPFGDLLEASPREWVAAHRGRTPVPLSNFLPVETPVEIACGLDVVFERACAKDPDGRFPTARDFNQALFEVLAPVV